MRRLITHGSHRAAAASSNRGLGEPNLRGDLTDRLAGVSLDDAQNPLVDQIHSFAPITASLLTDQSLCIYHVILYMRLRLGFAIAA